MRLHGSPPLLAILTLAPMLLGAADPVGDVGPCRASAPGPGDPPDLIGASGRVVEEGTSARWDLRFASPLVVPDREGRPFRVDILIRDPTVPALDVSYYRDLNRIVRYDAVPEQGVVILLLPERGQNVFLGGRVHGDRLTIHVPGRQITRDQDLAGVPIDDLWWTVVVRDAHRCDELGSARPHLRMVATESSPSAVPASPPASPGPAEGPSRARVGVIAALAVLAAASVAAAYGRRRRSRESPR